MALIALLLSTRNSLGIIPKLRTVHHANGIGRIKCKSRLANLTGEILSALSAFNKTQFTGVISRKRVIRSTAFINTGIVLQIRARVATPTACR